MLRRAGLLRIRETLGWELLDAGASDAFAVADHQAAHVYIKNADRLAQVKQLLAQTPGIARVLDREEQQALHINHPRAGELVAIAEPHHWFTYYYWLDDARAPDFAPTVDIHRKPGYDPAELFIDPAMRLPKLRVASRLLKKKLGMRYYMDVIPLHAQQVRGTHGRLLENPDEGPLLISSSDRIAADAYHMTDVKRLVLQMLD